MLQMKKQAKLREEEEERFKVRISALEAKAENSWPDEWGADVDRTEEEVREVEQSRAEVSESVSTSFLIGASSIKSNAL